jgi:hypothetical protein
MKFDLNLIPTTFDAVHVGLAATVVGLLVLQLLLLVVVICSLRGRCGKGVEEQRRKPEREEPRETAAAAVTIPTAPTPPAEPDNDAALQLLSLFQKEARFVDFIQEGLEGYADQDIGVAARVVHEGCRKVLKQYFELEPVRSEAEGQRIHLPKGFDAAAVRLTGNIVGSAPFSGTLVHRGWRVKALHLPSINAGHDNHIIAAAEVEL